LEPPTGFRTVSPVLYPLFYLGGRIRRWKFETEKKYEDTLQLQRGMAINSLKSVLFVRRVAFIEDFGHIENMKT
jgi:hypothetical protein